MKKTRDLKFEKDNNKLIFLIVIFFGMLIGSLFWSFFEKPSTVFNVEILLKNNNQFIDNLNNLDIIGQVFFNNMFFSLIIAGLILLVALIGAIILTFDFKKQKKEIEKIKKMSKNRKSINFWKK